MPKRDRKGPPPPSALMPDPPKPQGPESETDFAIAEPFLFGILALGIVNGLFSPLLGLAVILNPLWYPSGFLPGSMSFLMLFASLVVSTLTIMAAGVPAALYERFFNKGKTNDVSLWIWISVLAVITMPAAVRAIAALS